MSIHVNDSALGTFSKQSRHSYSVIYSLYVITKLKFVDSCLQTLIFFANMKMEELNSLLRYKM